METRATERYSAMCACFAGSSCKCYRRGVDGSGVRVAERLLGVSSDVTRARLSAGQGQSRRVDDASEELGYASEVPRCSVFPRLVVAAFGLCGGAVRVVGH